MTNIEKLLALAGSELGQPTSPDEIPSTIPGDLAKLIATRNGFVAFEGALHVFHFAHPDVPGEGDLTRWNAPETWRDAYADLVETNDVFFAEDVFGNQFCIRHGRIWCFDSETGEADFLADDMEAWAGEIVANFAVLTGQPLAHDWQVAHGSLALGQRLVPKIPFVLGGEFTVANLRAVESVKGMRFRGDIAQQLRDLPDGAPIELRTIE